MAKGNDKVHDLKIRQVCMTKKNSPHRCQNVFPNFFNIQVLSLLLNKFLLKGSIGNDGDTFVNKFCFVPSWTKSIL